MTQSKTQAVLTSLYGSHGRSSNNNAGSDTQQSLCNIYEEAILAYAEVVQEGLPLSRSMAMVQEHLLQCASCRQVYEESKAIYALGDEPPIPPSVQLPKFDLSFLPSPQCENSVEEAKHRWRNWAMDNLGRLVIEFSTQLLDTVQPMPQLAFAKSGPGQANKSLFELTIDEYDDLLVKIEGKQNRSQPEDCDLAISVDIPSRGGWPMLGGTHVALRRGDLPLDSVETDAFGQANVTNIKQADLPKLVITVAPD